MSSLPRYAIVLALSFSCAGSPWAANSQTKTSKKTPTNSVSGRVTIRGKGAPGIVVGIRSSDFSQQPPPAVKATTDQDGSYQITNIPPGNYQVSPMAPAFVNPDLVFSRARGKTLLLAEGEDVQDIDFSLVRGGVITGKVTDADGRPVIEERLTIVPEDQANTRGQMFPPVISGGFLTDDRGIYRIYGIPVGRYKISVGLAEEDSYSPVRFGRVAYKRTFYPDVTDPNDAKVIEVTEGTEATNIDITVGRNLPSFAASGTVVDGETGQPVMGLRFGLRRMVNDREAGVVLGIFTASNSQGEFRLENVTPGKYAVFIAPQAGSEVRAEAVFFEVIDQDVTGLLLKTVKGLSLTGTVALDGTYDKSVFAKLAQLRLRAYVRSESLSGSGQESPINTDGSFRIGGLPAGSANFALTAQDGRPPVSFAILRVERDGVIQPRGVEIKAGEQVSGVKIVVSYGTGSIRGEVKLENGPLPPGWRVVVWIKKLGDTESNFRPYNLDSRGHFLMEGVAAGNYELNVTANIPGRRAPPSAKQPISVTEGTVSDVVIVLDLKANPEPNP
ncbi:MAG: MSCRAMM family protein [Pyrinomonadaceae bacterium]